MLASLFYGIAAATGLAAVFVWVAHLLVAQQRRRHSTASRAARQGDDDSWLTNPDWWKARG